MGRKILAVPLHLVLSALCRDDRTRARTADGLPAEPPFVTCDGMPADARVIDVRNDPAFEGEVEILVESAEFPETPPGYCLDRVHLQMTSYTNYRTYLEMTASMPEGAIAIAGGKYWMPAGELDYLAGRENDVMSAPPLMPAEYKSPLAACAKLLDDLAGRESPPIDFDKGPPAEFNPAGPPDTPVNFREFL